MVESRDKEEENMITQNKWPEIIKKVGFDFSWDEKKVWQLEIPVEEMDISKLVWHLDIPFIWHKKGVYNLGPRKIIEDPKSYPEEYERMMKSDLKYPLDIMRNKGRWLLLDGLHRLMKACSLGMKKINVRKIPRSKIKEILK